MVSLTESIDELSVDLRNEECQYDPHTISGAASAHPSMTLPDAFPYVEKPLGEGPETGRHDRKAAGAGGQVPRDAREGEGEGDA